MTWTGRTLLLPGDHVAVPANAAVSAWVAPAGFQTGFGPSPPPDPWSWMRPMVPITAKKRTTTEVMVIQATEALELLRASGPDIAALGFRLSLHTLEA